MNGEDISERDGADDTDSVNEDWTSIAELDGTPDTPSEDGEWTSIVEHDGAIDTPLENRATNSVLGEASETSPPYNEAIPQFDSANDPLRLNGEQGIWMDAGNDAAIVSTSWANLPRNC